MRKRFSARPLGAMMGAAASAAPAEDDLAARGATWWRHVQILAADDMQGRGTGTPGYDKAADYVIGQFQALGLKPAGVEGYKQPIAFVEQTVLAAAGESPLPPPD